VEQANKAAEPQKQDKKNTEEQRDKRSAYDGSVLDAEVRERLGGADVDRRERRSQDAEEHPEVVAQRAGAGGGGGRGPRELAAHPVAPAFLPPARGASAAAAVPVAGLRIGPLHERRQHLAAADHSGEPERGGGQVRGLRLAARPRRRQPARHLLPQRREEAVPPFHGHGQGGHWQRGPFGE